MDTQDRHDSPEKDILLVDGLSLGYGEKLILESVSFPIQRGEIVTILGGSGCGKSTLLKGIIGLLEPTHGRVLFNGETIAGEGTESEALSRARRKMGVLFQSGALIGSLSLAENVAIPIKEFTAVPEDLIDEIVGLKLEMVKLGGYEDYMPSDLSGGMKKRAGLARAIAMDPEILFCDEPTAGLDPITAAEIDQLLIEVNKSLGITMVVITHELSSIRTISDRSIMLDKTARGIIAEGTPEELTKSGDKRVWAFFHRKPLEASAQSE